MSAILFSFFGSVFVKGVTFRLGPFLSITNKLKLDKFISKHCTRVFIQSFKKTKQNTRKAFHSGQQCLSRPHQTPPHPPRVHIHLQTRFSADLIWRLLAQILDAVKRHPFAKHEGIWTADTHIYVHSHNHNHNRKHEHEHKRGRSNKQTRGPARPVREMTVAR